MTVFPSPRLLLAAALLAIGLQGPAAQAQLVSRNGDYIVAIVNQELVTAAEVERRVAQVRANASRNGARLPPDEQLRQRVLDQLIEDRVLVTHARDSGVRVDEAELDRAVASIAQQNQVSMEEMRRRLRDDGIEFNRFREQVRDQIRVERVREREVIQSIRVTDAEIDAYLEAQRRDRPVELNLAQILVSVPESADEAQVAQRRVRAEQALARVRAGEAFGTVAREMSEDANRERGGELGLRTADRLPDVFVAQVRDLPSGAVAPTLLRTGAGFHVLKVVERRDTTAGVEATQTRARHILLRPSAELDEAAAIARLAEMRRDIESGKSTFEALARQNSQDGSATSGGELGWASPGQFVPEFEQAMNALPIGGLSEPVVSRFGVHLLQVLERRSVAVDQRQLREQARNVLRERKFQGAYDEWVDDLRARAYVEMREPPQ